MESSFRWIFREIYLSLLLLIPVWSHHPHQVTLSPARVSYAVIVNSKYRKMEKVKAKNVGTIMTSVTRNQLVTLDDLEEFRERLMSEFKRLLEEKISPVMPRKWLKSYEVRHMLNLSPGTLQKLRSNGTIPYTRVGGAIYYDREDIQRLLSTSKIRS